MNAERIFDEIDRHRMGYVSVSAFANWVCDNCGFHIADEDLAGLETSLDGANDYRITRQGFLDTVQVADDEEEEGEAADQNKSAEKA